MPIKPPNLANFIVTSRISSKFGGFRNHNPKNRGFLLFVSIIISGILITVALSVIEVTVKEIALSASGRESQVAFYAADAGIECASMWHIRHPGFGNEENETIFATSSASFVPGPGVGITCNGQDLPTLWNVTSSDTEATTVFTFSLADDPNNNDEYLDSPCVEVTVRNLWNDVNPNNGQFDTTGEIITSLTSRGFNVCDTNSPKLVERGIVRDINNQ